MISVDIYGTLVYTPDPPEENLIDGHDLPKNEQYWRRRELPSYFDHLRYDAEGNVDLSPRQEEYAREEIRRCKQGYWFYNNGIPTFITGKNYFYLQWWKLEDDIYPDYRDADRRYFLFLNHWENVLWCIGIGRGKKRREGASSQATSNLIYECIFYRKSNCGLVSKTLIDSRETFTEMVSFGYHQLPAFLKPRQLNRPDSVTEFVFAAKIEKAKSGKHGNNSKVNYRAPVLNAYDRGRMSRILADEGGKWPIDIPFSTFISIVTKTMIKGAKRVGFAECPSTVNEMEKAGGKEFKIFWDGANQFKSLGRKTTNRFVTYFTPAYDNYEGFLDKYGMSVIDEPTDEQYEYLVKKWVAHDPITGDLISELSETDIRRGARLYVISRRIGLSGDKLEEEIRQNPCTVQEMFEAANTGCTFNSYKINQQRKFLEDNPPNLRNIYFYRNEKQVVTWRDAVKSDEIYWQILWMPPKEEENKFYWDDDIRKPGRKSDGVIAVDGYSNEQGGRRYGSKACGIIYRKYDYSDPENSGMFAGWIYGRPSRKEILQEQIMLAGEFYGYETYWEQTADDYLSYYRNRGRLGYLGRFPVSAIDHPDRDKKERFYGFPISPFAMTKQTDCMIAYIEDFCPKIKWDKLLEQCLIFDPYKRTTSDCVVAAMIALVSSLDIATIPTQPTFALVELIENEHYGKIYSN